MEEMEINRLAGQLRELLVQMEFHADRDSREDFARWWIEEGRMARYFAMKGEKERLEEKFFRQLRLREADGMRQGSVSSEANEREVEP